MGWCCLWTTKVLVFNFVFLRLCVDIFRKAVLLFGWAVFLLLAYKVSKLDREYQEYNPYEVLNLDPVNTVTWIPQWQWSIRVYWFGVVLIMSVLRVHLNQKSRSNTAYCRSSITLTKVAMRPHSWELPKLMLRKSNSGLSGSGASVPRIL